MLSYKFSAVAQSIPFEDYSKQ